jgi:polyphosphate kinase 2 (PPK2 family)
LPARGGYAVFNRSHYENIIISRVHPEIILHENKPYINFIEDITEEFRTKRIQQTKNFKILSVAMGVSYLNFICTFLKRNKNIDS